MCASFSCNSTPHDSAETQEKEAHIDNEEFLTSPNLSQQQQQHQQKQQEESTIPKAAAVPSKNQQKLNNIWSNHLLSLQEYKRCHGHVRVPRKYGPLGEWVRTQRKYHKLNEKGQLTPLTQERYKILNDAGFVWFPTEEDKVPQTREGGSSSQHLLDVPVAAGLKVSEAAPYIIGEEKSWTVAQRRAHEIYNDQIQLLKRAEKAVRDANRALELAKKQQTIALAKRAKIEDKLKKCSEDVLAAELKADTRESNCTKTGDDWICMYKQLQAYKERIGNIRFPRGWETERKGERDMITVNNSSPEPKRRRMQTDDGKTSNVVSTPMPNNDQVQNNDLLMITNSSMSETVERPEAENVIPTFSELKGETSVTNNNTRIESTIHASRQGTKNTQYSTSDLDLYVWVSRMRKLPKKQLKHWQRQALDELGFVWHQYDATWSDRYQELIAYKNDHGHTQVPTVHSNLGVWVGTQRKQYALLQQKKPSHMTEERMKLLNEIGFIWKVNTWDERFEKLKTFKETFGHFQIPADYPNKKLRPWVTTQRSHYRFRQEGNASQITPERIKALESIGFAWKTREDWQTRYKELVEYFKRVSFLFIKTFSEIEYQRKIYFLFIDWYYQREPRLYEAPEVISMGKLSKNGISETPCE